MHNQLLKELKRKPIDNNMRMKLASINYDKKYTNDISKNLIDGISKIENSINEKLYTGIGKGCSLDGICGLENFILPENIFNNPFFITKENILKDIEFIQIKHGFTPTVIYNNKDININTNAVFDPCCNPNSIYYVNLDTFISYYHTEQCVYYKDNQVSMYFLCEFDRKTTYKRECHFLNFEENEGNLFW